MTNEHVPPVPTLSPVEARIWDKKVTALLTKKLEPIAKVEDKHVPGLGGDRPTMNVEKS